MSIELSFLDRLVEELIKSKHNNYSQECINFYINDELFFMEDLPKVYNRSQEKLKCSLIKHKNHHDLSNVEVNSKCIVYLHGFGSSRLQALSLVEQLPKEYCLCVFDMSGSGKSEGETITYGLKEQEDIGTFVITIEPVIAYLHKKKSIKEFVIWGRSMGAVAALLYGISYHKNRLSSKRKEKQHATAANSLKNSSVMIAKKEVETEIIILGLVLDSPFCNFKEVAQEIADKKVTIPSFLLSVAISYAEDSFAKILSQTIGQQYNPFKINFNQRINLAMPTIFLYSENDQIIAPTHSERIIRNMDSRYKKILISPCTHNQTRPPSVLTEVFEALTSFNKSRRKADVEASMDSSNRSMEKKRGINVYTPSKELKREESPAITPLKFYQAVTVELVRTEQPSIKSPRSRKNSKKHLITLSASKESNKCRELDSFSTEYFGPKLNPLNLDMAKYLNQKLIDPQQQQIKGLKMTRASKRFGLDKRRQIGLSNQKYL